MINSRSLDDLKIVKAEIEAVGRPARIEAYAADISVPAEVEKMISHCVTLFGKIDIIISNAGYMTRWAKIAEHDPETWWRTWVCLHAVHTIVI